MDPELEKLVLPIYEYADEVERRDLLRCYGAKDVFEHTKVYRGSLHKHHSSGTSRQA